ncbi:unnamed protein product [Pedinophyceae sp. YPF-701]|nr:unnamed protein product [Pedinophyceae sp. YPF-701]
MGAGESKACAAAADRIPGSVDAPDLFEERKHAGKQRMTYFQEFFPDTGRVVMYCESDARGWGQNMGPWGEGTRSDRGTTIFTVRGSDSVLYERKSVGLGVEELFSYISGVTFTIRADKAGYIMVSRSDRAGDVAYMQASGGGLGLFQRVDGGAKMIAGTGGKVPAPVGHKRRKMVIPAGCDVVLVCVLLCTGQEMLHLLEGQGG